MTNQAITWAGGAGVYTAVHNGRPCVTRKSGATWEARFDGGHVGDYRTLREAKAAVAAAAAREAERADREAEDPAPAPAPAPAESRQVRRRLARRQVKARQILRSLDLPAYREAWRQIVEMNAAALAAREAKAAAAWEAERADREAEDPAPTPAPTPAESRQVRRQTARRRAKADLSRAKLAAAKAPGGAAAIRGAF